MSSLSLVPAGDHRLDTHDWELAVLGSLMLAHHEALAVCRRVGLSHRHFSVDKHLVLYRAFNAMADEGTTADPVSLQIFLARYPGALERAGGMNFLVDLPFVVPSPANVGYYAEMLVRAQQGPREMAARGEQEAQVGEALAFLDLDAASFLRWPFRPLDDVLGGIAPGTMHMFAAHTGTGKTSFVETCKKHWLMQGVRVYGAGLETAPMHLRTQLACRVLDVDHGELFKGNLQRLAHWPELRAAIKAEIARQRTDPFYEAVRFAPFERLSEETARRICENAADFKADVVIIDHLDHLDSSSRNGNDGVESRAILAVIEAMTKSYGLRTVLTSQTNREGKAANRLRDHYPLTSEMVRWGDHKINASTTFCGLRRPLKPDWTKEEMAAARANYEKVREILAKNTMAINVLKDRHGNNVATDVLLGFWKGEVLETQNLAASAERRSLA